MPPEQMEQFLKLLNDAWLTQDYVALRELYHSDVVLLPPDAGEPITGRAQVLDLYRDFHAACRVERFAITDQTSWQFDAAKSTTTMVHMRFAIDYRMGTTADSSQPLQSEEGLEVYTLITADAAAAPQIIWRAQFTL